jgi:hypothetical protein
MSETNRHRSTTPPVRAGVTLAAAVLAVLVALASAGCGGAPDDPGDAVAPSPTATGAGGLGPGGPGNAGDEAAGQQQPSGPAFPDTPRAYAEAIIEAWSGSDLDRLADLTTALVHEQIVQIPGPPSPDWTFIECDTGHYCSFYNSDGDFLILLIPAASVGSANAAAQVSYNVITYPNDDIDYVREFVEAWQNGNLGRMHLLAWPEAVAALQQITPGQVTSYGRVGGGAGLSVVMVTGVGFEFEVQVRTMFLGHPDAIASVASEI